MGSFALSLLLVKHWEQNAKGWEQNATHKGFAAPSALFSWRLHGKRPSDTMPVIAAPGVHNQGDLRLTWLTPSVPVPHLTDTLFSKCR